MNVTFLNMVKMFGEGLEKGVYQSRCLQRKKHLAGLAICVGITSQLILHDDCVRASDRIRLLQKRGQR